MFFRRFKNKELGIMICVVGVMLIVWAIVFVIELINCNSSDESYDKPNLPEVQFNGGSGYVDSQQENSVEIPAVTGLVVKSGARRQKLNLTNPSNNRYAFVVEIYLGDGTRLYKSDYINPSGAITEAEFSVALKAGLYKDALMIYTCYTTDDRRAPLTRCEFPIEIRSSEEELKE